MFKNLPRTVVSICLTTILTVSILGCSSQEVDPESGRTETAQVSASGKRAEEKISQIQLGQTRAQVEAILGQPMMEQMDTSGLSATYMLGMEGMQAQMRAAGHVSTGMGILNSLEGAAGLAGAMNPMAGAAASGIFGIGSSIASMGSAAATEAAMPKMEDIRMVTVQYANDRVASIQKMNPGAMAQ
jgi:hypothetical protein